MSVITQLPSLLTGSRRAVQRACAGALAAAFVLGSAGPALAQRYGDTQFPVGADGGATRRFPAVAYDSTSNAYLVAWGVIQLGARFVSSEGIPLGAPTPLNTDGVSRQAGAVRVACGANVNVCLITWLEETPSRIVGRLVRNNGGNVQFLSDRFPISDTGGAKLSSAAPTVTYSPVATEFLVSWTEFGAGPDVYAQRVTYTGVPVGARIPVAITGGWEGLPSATYNSALDEYFVAFYFEPGMDAVGGVRIKPGTGEILGGHNPALGNLTLYAGPFEKYPEVVYNSAANEYLAITWGTNFTIHGQRVGAAGQPVGGILILAVGGGDGIGIGYSPVANGYLATYQHPTVGEAWASLIGSDGAAGASFQATVTGGANARQPQAAGSSQAARFLLVSTHEYAAVKSQMVQSGSGGPAPPPPPPPPPTCTFVLSMPGWSFPASGGSGGFTLTASSSTCAWTGTSSAGWLTLASGGTSGTGSRSIGYTVAPNSSSSPRNATITIGGQVFSVSQAPTLRSAAHDMTGDGLSDLLWFNVATSQVSIWQMSGPNVQATPWVNGGAPAAAGWTPTGMGDLNADGRADIVWRHQNGTLAAWFMYGTTPIESGVLRFHSTGGTAIQSDPGWQIRAVGDLDGDGSADLVWQHASGALALWRMQAFTVVETVGLSVGALSDPNWQIAGAGDIDGDGKADLIFQHMPSGFMAAWLMNGRQVRSSNLLSVHVTGDPNWFAKGVGDVNGDGYADILWQHADGRLSVWYLNGFTVTYWNLLSIPAVVNTDWRLMGPS